jgi:hypothetical protein
MRALPFIILLSPLLAGCATDHGYQPLDGRRYVGHTESRLAEDMYQVTYHGWHGMSYGYARSLAVLRAAEIGRRLGYSHLTVEGEQNITQPRESLESMPIIGSDERYYFSETVRRTTVVVRVRYHDEVPKGRHLEAYAVEPLIADITSVHNIELDSGR